MRISHLGPRGTYTEEAALLHAPDAELLPCSTVTAAIDAVIDGRTDAAVCAMENSIEGSVSIETLDLLLNPDFPLRVAGEVVVTIRHALVGAPGSDLATARRVYSHPQALAQCRRHLAELVPHAEPMAALSTAGAIESAMNEPGALAVGNERAAALYGAEVHARDIGDEAGNETRFVVLRAEDGGPTGDDKTSLAFTTQHDRPGSLVEVLQLFAQRSLNMTRIESRPTRRQLGTYVFLVDIQGHRTDPDVVDALTEAEAITSWFRVLGSYPRWQG
jgi:prephenate dehydratase